MCAYMSSKVWVEITYPSPNFKGKTVEVWEWMNDFIPHLMDHSFLLPPQEKYSAYQYRRHIREALDILHAELPRTFVNLVAMFDITPVANMGNGVLCKGFHMWVQ